MLRKLLPHFLLLSLAVIAELGTLCKHHGGFALICAQKSLLLANLS